MNKYKSKTVELNKIPRETKCIVTLERGIYSRITSVLLKLRFSSPVKKNYCNLNRYIGEEDISSLCHTSFVRISFLRLVKTLSQSLGKIEGSLNI